MAERKDKTAEQPDQSEPTGAAAVAPEEDSHSPLPAMGDWVRYVQGDVEMLALVTHPERLPLPRLDSEGNERPPAQALTVFPANAQPFTVVASKGDKEGTWH